MRIPGKGNERAQGQGVVRGPAGGMGCGPGLRPAPRQAAQGRAGRRGSGPVAQRQDLIALFDYTDPAAGTRHRSTLRQISASRSFPIGIAGPKLRGL